MVASVVRILLSKTQQLQFLVPQRTQTCKLEKNEGILSLFQKVEFEIRILTSDSVLGGAIQKNPLALLTKQSLLQTNNPQEVCLFLDNSETVFSVNQQEWVSDASHSLFNPYHTGNPGIYRAATEGFAVEQSKRLLLGQTENRKIAGYLSVILLLATLWFITMGRTHDSHQRLMRLERAYQKMMLRSPVGTESCSPKNESSTYLMASRVSFAQKLQQRSKELRAQPKVTSRELLQRIQTTKPTMRSKLKQQFRSRLIQHQQKPPVVLGLKTFLEQETERQQSLRQGQLIASKQTKINDMVSVRTDDTSALTTVASDESDEEKNPLDQSSPSRSPPPLVQMNGPSSNTQISGQHSCSREPLSAMHEELSSVVKGKFQLEPDGVVDVTLARSEDTSRGSRTTSTASCFEEFPFGNNQISISKSRSFSSMGGCHTIIEEPSRVSQHTVFQMRRRAESLELHTRFTKEKALVLKQDLQFHTAVFVTEQIYLEDSKDTAYEELKELLIDESREADRLQIRLKKLKRQHSIMRKVATFGFLLALAIPCALAMASKYLSDNQWSQICAPARAGTKLSDWAADRMEAPWWVPQEYSSWKGPIYHLVGCSNLHPRMAVELSHGMLWATQLSTGKVLSKKPATNVFVKIDKLEVLDQRSGSYVEMDVPWSTSAS